MIDKDLTLLISDFLKEVNSSLELLEKKFGSKSVHQLWRDKKIAQRGEISDGITYQIHGNGCMIEFPDHCVDFDFDPEERADWFDAWRLYNYACEYPDKYPKYTKLENVELELKKHEQQKIVSKIKNSYSNLYFLQDHQI
ncbi:DUF6896 domain-containing protein [Pseudomonas sp. NPDC087639]|uniref:DUF6896 domain-containing protein n=1 Tax=Pseudomonas sp. NPDC087639 TaxID=3364445 RepID=UPI003816DE64